MAKNHLFSASLYDTLFQHNVISSDGYVKATDEKLLDFKKFLVQQARDKTAFNYKKRKAMVDELCILLEEDALTRSQTKKFTMLLRE
ncbi:uncharacterized protein CDAR_41301 [Caerostris darwini]|uniref:LAGLIDADG homing endonuclease n=1 Tax=Caerostris darwini TaxID=1538125 RepID=A0AAV4SK47_9ARAC|nr:uncharacterized protein CDAR_41301 [Caerostris darwini]